MFCSYIVNTSRKKTPIGLRDSLSNTNSGFETHSDHQHFIRTFHVMYQLVPLFCQYVLYSGLGFTNALKRREKKLDTYEKKNVLMQLIKLVGQLYKHCTQRILRTKSYVIKIN